MDKDYQELINLAIGDSTYISDYRVVRIAGGAMYQRDVWEGGKIITSTDTFVPFPLSISQKLKLL